MVCPGGYHIYLDDSPCMVIYASMAFSEDDRTVLRPMSTFAIVYVYRARGCIAAPVDVSLDGIVGM